MSACSIYNHCEKYIYLVITFAMKIQTTDRCNKKSSSFTNTRTLSTKDNLTPQLQWVRIQLSTEFPYC